MVDKRKLRRLARMWARWSRLWEKRKAGFERDPWPFKEYRRVRVQRMMDKLEDEFDLADELMPYVNAHQVNEGTMWERHEAFHVGCPDCQLTTARLAHKIVYGQ